MSTKLTPEEALQTLMGSIASIASLYSTGRRTEKRYGHKIVDFVEGSCDIAHEVNAGLLANALAHEIFASQKMEKVMLGSDKRVYPGKGFVKTYIKFFAQPKSEALASTLAAMNADVHKWEEFPPLSMYALFTNVLVPTYISACEKTATPVLDTTTKPGTTLYVFRGKNTVIKAIADLFANAIKSPQNNLAQRIITAVLADISSDYEKEEEVVPATVATTSAPPVVKVAIKADAVAVKAKVVASPQQEVEKAAPAPQQEEAPKEKEVEEPVEEKKYDLTEDEFISIFTAMTEEGKERWANKLRPVLEAKKEPYMEQLKKIKQMQLDLQAQATVTAEKIAKIDALISRLSAFFTA